MKRKRKQIDVRRAHKLGEKRRKRKVMAKRNREEDKLIWILKQQPNKRFQNHGLRLELQRNLRKFRNKVAHHNFSPDQKPKQESSSQADKALDYGL